MCFSNTKFSSSLLIRHYKTFAIETNSWTSWQTEYYVTDMGKIQFASPSSRTYYPD